MNRAAALLRRLWVMPIAITSWACSAPTAPEPAVEHLPTRLRLFAEASGADASGTTGRCSLDFVVNVQSEVSRARGRVLYQGTGGGGGSRTVLDRGGSGFGLLVDMFFTDVQVQLDTSGRVDIRLTRTPDTQSRFYQKIARFESAITRDGYGHGRWTCAPFDVVVFGYNDNSLEFEGSWSLEPAPAGRF